MNAITKNGWIGRLWKVVFTFIVILTLPMMFFAGVETEWTGGPERYSRVFLYMAVFTLAAYLFYIFLTKIFLYIFKNESFMKSGFSKKGYLLLLLPIILTLIASGVFAFAIEPVQKARAEEKKESDYAKAIESVKENSDKVMACITPAVEKKYLVLLNECTLLKNKIKHDYDFCVSLSMINSPASCIYENNYRKLDCTEGTLRENARKQVSRADMPAECSPIMDEYIQAKTTIAEYEKKTN